MIKAAMVAVMLLSATTARAQSADAPIMAIPLVPGYSCIPDEQRINEGKAVVRCQAEKDALTKDTVIIPKTAFILGTTGVVILTIVATVLVVKFTEPKTKP